jgi:hypothetical protein
MRIQKSTGNVAALSELVRCDYADIGITGVMPRGLLCRVGADDRLFSLEIAI